MTDGSSVNAITLRPTAGPGHRVVGRVSAPSRGTDT